METIELVVLDLAGTTVEDRGQVPKAFISALGEHGIPISAEDVRALRGASKRQAILRLVREHAPEAEDRLLAAVYDDFQSRLREAFATGVRSIPGSGETIEWLRTRGIKVALNTGFDRAITDLILEALAWQDTVDAVVCGDDVPAGRPAPYLIFRAMERTRARSVAGVVNVGDTVLDLEAGRNAGVAYNVGVLSGAHSRSELESYPHAYLLESVAELPNLLE